MAVERAEARAQGLLRYFTGKPCCHRHICERRTSSGCCVECGKFWDSKYRVTSKHKTTRRHRETTLEFKARRRCRNATELARAAKRKHMVSAKGKIVRRRYESTIQGRLVNGLRARLRSAIRGGAKSGSAVRDLGCSIPEFMTYIEKQFRPGMTWRNRGTHGWHLDHKKPLASFNLNDRKQLRQACHYTNYQPLWALPNLQKRDRLDWREAA